MTVVLGNHAPKLSTFRGRSGGDILCARQAVRGCMFVWRERSEALGKRASTSAITMLRVMGLR